MDFPIDLQKYKAQKLDPDKPLPDEDKQQLLTNIQVTRDAIIFFTAVAGARGLGGHTGGAYDIVPEVMIAEAFMNHNPNIIPIHYDEAGHRVALQYIMSVLRGHMPADQLFHYREFDKKLPGHPERGLTPGVEFSSGRLGHMWPFVNGVALQDKSKTVVMFGSDGSQQEGNDAEAARLCAAHNLNVKLLIDDNNITIAGHPSDYMPGYNVQKTLQGHGIPTDVGDGENIDELYTRMQKAFTTDGPIALINKRFMAPDIDGVEDTPKGHDVIATDKAIAYLEKNDQIQAAEYLKSIQKEKSPKEYLGSSQETGKNRSEFGKIVAEIMNDHPKDSVLVFDNDLEGSTGLKAIREAHPDQYILAGIMERGNFSAAAGFGSQKGKQAIYATFSAFLEMVISEITMARLNECNVLSHFSHAGVDDMADNTCHFGINNFFAAGGIEEHDQTRLYFPADPLQLKSTLQKVFPDEGLRFVFSTRSAVPFILKEDGSKFYEDYEFEKDKDEIIREGTQGYIVSYGEMLYRSLDAVERLKKEGIDIGLINKPTLNIKDEDMLKKLNTAPFVLLAESQNRHTGLGIRFGTWLLEAGFKGKYTHLGTTKLGPGGQPEQIPYQGLDPDSIIKKVKEMI